MKDIAFVLIGLLNGDRIVTISLTNGITYNIQRNVNKGNLVFGNLLTLVGPDGSYAIIDPEEIVSLAFPESY